MVAVLVLEEVALGVELAVEDARFHVREGEQATKGPRVVEIQVGAGKNLAFDAAAGSFFYGIGEQNESALCDEGH